MTPADLDDDYAAGKEPSGLVAGWCFAAILGFTAAASLVQFLAGVFA